MRHNRFLPGSLIAAACTLPMVASAHTGVDAGLHHGWLVGSAAGLVGVFAIFHGMAHGQALAGESGALFTLGGMLCATVLLHAACLALGWTLRHHDRWLPRIAGAGVAPFGVALLGGPA